MFKIEINKEEYTCFYFQHQEDVVSKDNISVIIRSLDIVVLGRLPKENDLTITWGAVKYKGVKTLPHFDNKTNTTRFQLFLGER